MDFMSYVPGAMKNAPPAKKSFPVTTQHGIQTIVYEAPLTGEKITFEPSCEDQLQTRPAPESVMGVRSQNSTELKSL